MEKQTVPFHTEIHIHTEISNPQVAKIICFTRPYGDVEFRVQVLSFGFGRGSMLCVSCSDSRQPTRSSQPIPTPRTSIACISTECLDDDLITPKAAHSMSPGAIGTWLWHVQFNRVLSPCISCAHSNGIARSWYRAQHRSGARGYRFLLLGEDPC